MSAQNRNYGRVGTSGTGMGPGAGTRSSTRQQNMLDAIAQTSRVRTQTRTSPMGIFLMALFAVFLVVDIIAVVLGTDAYAAIHRRYQEDEQAQAVLGPVIAAVRANDTQGALGVGTGPEGRSLVLIESLDTGTYETRIYLWQGKIVEEYALAGAAYTPQKATVLAEATSFDFSYSKGLLTLRCNTYEQSVALRSVQDGAATSNSAAAAVVSGDAQTTQGNTAGGDAS